MIYLLIQGGGQAGSQAGDFLTNRVFIAIVAAAVGIVLTGLVNFFLQRFQDNRRFENERTVQKERWDREDKIQQQHWSKEEEDQRRRWDREDEAQKQRWEREDGLRNYEERRRTYTGLMQMTDHAQLIRAQQGARMEDALEYRETVARLSGELRMLTPIVVRGMGERLIQSFLECFDAYLRNSGDIEAKTVELAERRYLFMRVAQKDLGLEREEDKDLLKTEYQGIQEKKRSLGGR